MSGQHVRITLEGVATCDEGGQILRFRPGSDKGPLVLISKAWPGVTVEDVTPPRTWTDGDVVMCTVISRSWSASRVNGKWWTTAQAMDGEDSGPWATSDDKVTRGVERGSFVVLRYQAGE